MFVDDKKLSELLHGVTGLALGHPEIQPVVNAKVSGDKLVAKTKGGSAERFLEHLKKHRIEAFSPAQAREICKAVGLRPSSSTYVIGQLKNNKLIRHNGKPTSASAYTVVQK
jgi:hypothetical protein